MSESFEADLAAFAKAVGKSLDATCKAVAIKWFSSTVLSTPVDTGRLRGNWMITLGHPATGTRDVLDKSGSEVTSEIAASVGGVGSVNFLTNNLPYAQRIEYGGSNQAPNGMVRINFARIQTIIKQVVAEHRV